VIIKNALEFFFKNYGWVWFDRK